VYKISAIRNRETTVMVEVRGHVKERGECVEVTKQKRDFKACLYATMQFLLG